MQIVVAILLALLGAFLMQAALTHAAARLMRVENATWRRALVVVLALSVWSAACLIVGQFLVRSESIPALVTMLVLPVLGLIVVYRRAYHARRWQWLGFFVLQFVMFGAAYGYALLFRQYVGEAFVIPSNGMSPTINGKHVTTVCPKCGGAVTHSIQDFPQDPFIGIPVRPPQVDTWGACSQCWEYFVGLQVDPNLKPVSGDRVLVNKLDAGNVARWKIVVFRYPLEPKTLFVQRIVGLPGEEIVFDDDGVPLIDGRRVEPPADLPKLRYSARPAENNKELFGNFDEDPIYGDKRKPMRLGEDEYFLLGDCTHRSLDSRMWGPVKRDAILAPAVLTYWPPSRWRILK